MRILIWVISLVAMGYAGYVVWQPLELDVDQMEKDKSTSRPLVMKKARFNDFESGKKSWLLLADVAKIYHEEEITLLYTVRGEMYDSEDPKKISTMVAKQGNIHAKSEVVSLKGDVKVFFDNGDTLLSEELILDRKKDLLYSDKKVRLDHQKDQIEADALRYEMKSEKLTLKNPVMAITVL